MKAKLVKKITQITAFLAALAFAVKFGGTSLLRTYIELGLGNCAMIPILCLAPQKVTIEPSLKGEYLAELLPYQIQEIGISLPKGFSVVKEKIKRVYYKRRHAGKEANVVYLLYEKPDFFVNLFPQIKRQGINNDYLFLNRTMYAKTQNINNLTDALFVIVKTIFTPYLGKEKDIKMLQITQGGIKGFVNYNLTPSGNYFDCNLLDRQNNFFKVYIKDGSGNLDLDKVLAIISTVHRAA